MKYAGAFRRVAKDLVLRITDSSYRHQRAELARLRSLPRYKATVTNLIGIPLEIVDAYSFLGMYHEICEQQIYRFQARTEEPFIIDGGANIGLSILYLKELYPRSEIIGFEPDEKIFSVLERNVQRSGYENIKLLRRALWTRQTTLGFVSEGSWAGRLARTEEHAGQVVQTARLRDYLNRPVDFLKLDIEGAETEVLADCADLLGRVENLFVEYHSFGDEPQSIHTLLSVMQGAGFRVHVRASTGSPQPFLFRALNLGMDNQLCVYAFRAEQNVAAGPRLCE
ncbi:MAG: FkbM family methyltransferase [Acidobacteria bacterium]|nr:MAG: FkbM family methyltransferase [Acidobacteriota bacterium]